jgi:hypothetical protein
VEEEEEAAAETVVRTVQAIRRHFHCILGDSQHLGISASQQHLIFARRQVAAAAGL